MTVRLLIADDHAVVREGLRLVMGLDSSVEVLEEEACIRRQAVELAHRTHTDVIPMDLLMPDIDRTAATRRIHAELPDIAVVTLTGQLTDSVGSSVLAAVRAAAIGHLYKAADEDELRGAVHAPAAGGVQLASAAAKQLIREMTAPPSHASLTAPQSQVLVLMANGRAMKEIARELRIGQQTVKTYVSNILANWGCGLGPKRRCTPSKPA